ncbi:MAG: hypothetical protein R3B69_01045 [Candidatus Paceibacterota bacterium]
MGEPERILNKTAWQKAVQVATTAMEDYFEDEPVTCAHSYHATYVTAFAALAWFATLTRDNQVDDHIFFYWKHESITPVVGVPESPRRSFSL